MFSILFTIFIVYLLWLIVKPFLVVYTRHKYQQKVNEMFNQTFGGGQAPGGQPYGDGGSRQSRNGEANRNTRSAYSRMKKKIFSRDEGEYVEFEEIEVSVDDRRRDASTSSSSAYTPREPQVSDADWEEIR